MLRNNWMQEGLLKHFNELPSAAYEDSMLWVKWKYRSNFASSYSGTLRAINNGPAPATPLSYGTIQTIKATFGKTYGTALIAAWTDDLSTMESALKSTKKTVVAAALSNPRLPWALAVPQLELFVVHAPPASVMRAEIMDGLLENPKQLHRWVALHETKDVKQVFEAHDTNVRLARMAFNKGNAAYVWRTHDSYGEVAPYYRYFDVRDPAIRALYIETGRLEHLGTRIRESHPEIIMEVASELSPADFEKLFSGFALYDDKWRRVRPLETTSPPSWLIPLYRLCAANDVEYPIPYVEAATPLLPMEEAAVLLDPSNNEQVETYLDAGFDRAPAALALLHSPKLAAISGEQPYGVQRALTVGLNAAKGDPQTAVRLLVAAMDAGLQPGSYETTLHTQLELFVSPETGYLPDEFSCLKDAFARTQVVLLMLDRFTADSAAEILRGMRSVRWTIHPSVWNHPRVVELLTILFASGNDTDHNTVARLYEGAFKHFADPGNRNVEAMDVLLNVPNLPEVFPYSYLGKLHSTHPTALTTAQYLRLAKFPPRGPDDEYGTQYERNSVAKWALGRLFDGGYSPSGADLLNLVAESSLSIEALVPAAHDVLLGYVTEHLGDDPNRWRDFSALSKNGWEGSLEDLLRFIELSNT